MFQSHSLCIQQCPVVCQEPKTSRRRRKAKLGKISLSLIIKSRYDTRGTLNGQVALLFLMALGKYRKWQTHAGGVFVKLII